MAATAGLLAATFLAGRPAYGDAAKGDAAREGAPKENVLAPFLTLRPSSGIYEGVAFAVDGRSLALLRTDNTARAALEWVDLAADARPVERFSLPPDAATLDALVALPEGNVAVLRAGEKEGTRALTVFDRDGKKRWEASGLWQVGWGRADSTALVLVQRTATGGWSVSARDAGSGKIVAKPRAFDLDGRGLLRGLGLKPIAFLPGFAQLLTERPGAYDKGKDTRLPNLAVVVDALTGKILHEDPIEDRFGWALTSQLRTSAAHPDQRVFLRLADNGDASRVALELVDARGLVHPVALPGNPRVYDRQSLVVAAGESGEQLTFSLSVDPVNPDAVARKKADLPSLDVFELKTNDLPPGRSPHPGGGEVAPLSAIKRARVALSDRPVTWLRDGDTLVVLRRFKSFARGGDQVDILRLAPLP